MKHKAALFAAGLSLFAAARALPDFAPAQEAALPNFWDEEEDETLAKRIVSAMTDDELLAQVFMFGWSGHEPSGGLVAWVERRSLGNVKVFGWGTDDAEKVARAINLLQEKAIRHGRFGIPLFVATDQEGGAIRHIKGATSDAPGNMAIGASGLALDAYLSGYYIAAELAALGVNMNLAPVADLYTSRDSAVTGTRSFGDSPQEVAALSAAFAAGTRDAGLLATAKHFPGHGAASGDSHKSLPKIDADMETLKKRELIPFAALIGSGIPAVMTAHVSFPQVTGTDEPASLSPFILQGLLREAMGFEGLIITDDIAMEGALSCAGSAARAAKLAILAGSDIILCSILPSAEDDIWRLNANAMKEPRFREAVQGAAFRVIKAKLKYFKGEGAAPIFPDIEKVDELLPAPGSDEFFAAQAERSVTVLYGGEHLPIKEGDEGKILIAAQSQAFIDEGMRRFPSADAALIGSGPLRPRLGEYGAIILGLSSEEGLETLNALSRAARGDAAVIAVLLDDISLIPRAKEADAALAVYSSSACSMRAAFEAIAGDFIPQGSLPFRACTQDL